MTSVVLTPNTGFPMAGIGFRFGNPPNTRGAPYAFVNNTLPFLGRPYYDPVFQLLRGTVFDRYMRDARSAINYTGSNTLPATIRVPAPSPITSGYKGDKDQFLFSTLLNNLAQVKYRSALSHDPSFLREHNVTHANIVGNMKPADMPGYIANYVSASRTVAGVNFDKELYFPSGNTKRDWPLHLAVSNVGGSTVFTIHHPNTSNLTFPNCPWYYTSDLFYKLLDLRSWSYSEESVVGSGPPAIHRDISVQAHSYTEDLNGFTFKYSYDFDAYRVADLADSTVIKWLYSSWECVMTCKIYDPPVTGIVTGLGAKPYHSGMTWEFYIDYKATWHRRVRQNGVVIDDPLPAGRDKMLNSVSDCTGVFIRPVTGSLPSDFIAKLPQARKILRIDEFHSAVTANMRELTPSAYYSSAQALEGLLEVLKTNYLEFFKDAGELVSLIPDVALLFQALRDIKNMRPQGVLRLGDFIAETYLKYQFGIAPTIDAIEELNSKGSLVQKRVASLLNGEFRTIHGKFKYDLPYLKGFATERPIRMDVRSKLTVRMTDESFMRTLVGLKASGLIPSLSQIWETLPLSFVIDWFTNMSRRYADIDTQFFFACVDVKYAVHSITVYHDLDSSELDDFSVTAVDVVSNKSYNRYVSRLMPSLNGSVYDFRGANPRPSAGVGGSLAWVFSR